MKVLIYQQQNERSRKICNAFFESVKSCGDDVSIVKMSRDMVAPAADVAIFYGQSDGGKELLKSYVAAGKHVLYVDMGYWNRKTKQDVYGGYHKISLDGLHPSKFQLQASSSDDRFIKQDIPIKRVRSFQGKHILLAGLSGKASAVNDLKPYEWELETIKLIKATTNRPIVYRPKPSWKEAQPIPGTIFSPRTEDLHKVLLNSHCVVTRHSNVTIDGIVEAIPGYTQLGAASDICYSFEDLDKIENATTPLYEHRYDFCSKLAYCQWNLEEMRNGAAWRWYRGLIS